MTMGALFKLDFLAPGALGFIVQKGLSEFLLFLAGVCRPRIQTRGQRHDSPSESLKLLHRRFSILFGIWQYDQHDNCIQIMSKNTKNTPNPREFYGAGGA